MTLSDQSRVYVAEARRKKAEQMSFLAWGFGIASADIARMNEAQWAMLARAAGVPLPSPETRRMVVKRVAIYEEKGAVAA